MILATLPEAQVVPPSALSPAPPLILGAGWGSSGTRAMATALVNFGLTTGHCFYYVNVSAGAHCFANFCRHARDLLQQQLCARLAADSDRDDMSGFRVFDGLDAIFDVPVPDYFPQLWQAYGATARVILTYRTPTAWYASRSKHHPKECLEHWQSQCARWVDELQVQGDGNRTTTMPGSWGASHDEPLSAARWCNASARKTAARVDADTLQRAYSAHNALVRSLVPSSRLLDIDITTLTAAEAWARVAQFLQRPIPADACLDADCRFPELRSRSSVLARASAGVLAVRSGAFPKVNLTDDFPDQRCRLSVEMLFQFLIELNMASQRGAA